MASPRDSKEAAGSGAERVGEGVAGERVGKAAVAKGQGASCDVAELNYILSVAGAKTCCSKSWWLPFLKERCLRLEKYLKKPQGEVRF